MSEIELDDEDPHYPHIKICRKDYHNPYSALVDVFQTMDNQSIPFVERRSLVDEYWRRDNNDWAWRVLSKWVTVL